MLKRVSQLLLVTAGLWLSGCIVGAQRAPADPAAPTDRIATLTETTRVLMNGDVATYTVGVIAVPERRDRADSRTISVEFYYLPAANSVAAKAPPIYWLRGGPGFPGLGQYLQRDGYYETYLEPLTAAGPVVVVGQRGFGQSTPTPCPALPEVSLTEVDERAERLERFRAGALACLAASQDAGIDIAGYTVIELANDVADVAAFLKHDRIQLFGNSFGSHSGMAVIATHPELVERATLSALEGPDHTFDLPAHKRNALIRIAQDAQAHPAVSAYKPERGFVAAFESLIAQADVAPFYVDTVHVRTQQPIQLRIDGDALRQLAQGTTRGTQWRYALSAWPQDIAAMLAGDFSDAATRLQYIWLNTEVRNAAEFSMECGSGISAVRAELMHDATGLTLLNATNWFDSRLCREWPVDLGAAFRRGFVSDVPVVLLHGDWDTSTPFENAVQFRRMFTDQHFIHVVGGSHGAYIEAGEESPAFVSAMQQWMRSGDRTALPKTVQLPAYAWQ